MGVLRGTAQEKELSGTVFFSTARSSLLKIMKLLAVMVVVTAGLVSGMDVGKGGVYDSPMAQDYYVKRFGFMFGGGRSGMSGIKALQNKGMVELELETDLVDQMKNSVESYYKEVLPETVTAPRLQHKRIRLRKRRKWWNWSQR